MNYLFFSPMVWNNYRGRNVELPVALAKNGNACTYINPLNYRNGKNDAMRFRQLADHSQEKVKVIDRFSRLPKSIWMLFKENRDNVRWVKKQKPDVVISFDHLMSISICLYCSRKKIPFIFDVMDDWEMIEKNSLVRFYYKHIVRPIIGRRAFAITSTSNRQAELFRKYNRNVHLIPNGKPFAFIQQATAFFTDGKKTVNFISTLKDWYDFDLLFNVFAEFPDLQLNIYGEGELLDELKNKAQHFSNISIKGNVDSALLPRLTAESLFGILPLKLNALNETTCPIKLFDYWSAKKAVIASNR